MGRKLKGDKSERKHNKYGEDNMMNKVKTYYLKFVQDQTNSTLSPGHDKFCKISKEVSSNLQKDFNIVLMNKKIGDIFRNILLMVVIQNHNMTKITILN